MIAKIAHGYALAEVGPIFSPLLPELILGKRTDNAGQLVGAVGPYPREAVPMRHAVGLFERDFAGRPVLFAGVILFAPVLSSMFVAAVGERID